MFTENYEIENQTKFGLLGLLDVIRMTNADLNTLALGSDLTTLGLNLNSSECLYSTFASPWAEAPTMREPQFSLPMCYYMQPPPLKTSPLHQSPQRYAHLNLHAQLASLKVSTRNAFLHLLCNAQRCMLLRQKVMS